MPAGASALAVTTDGLHRIESGTGGTAATRAFQPERPSSARVGRGFRTLKVRPREGLAATECWLTGAQPREP